MHILIVDDEKDILDTMVTILEMKKYSISTASDGQEALEVIEQNLKTEKPVDILVTDIAMPKLSGTELIEEIHRRGLEIPILAITAYGTKNRVVELIQKHVEGYIDKPFTMDALLEKINDIAEKVLKVKQAQKTTETTLQTTQDRVKTLEEQLVSSQEFEILGKLSTGIMHDFNNMLTVISGYADLIGEQSPLSDNPSATIEKIQYFGEQILKSTITAQNTIRQMQTFVRHNEQAFCQLNMHDVITEAIKMVNGSIGKNVNILAELKAPNPCIQGERTLLHNALINLFINARDAMERAGQITIQTEQSNDNDNLIISIKDTGKGMDASVKKRVFEPFFTTKGKKGNGLGLSGVLNAVNRHRGVVECDSTLNCGTEFRLMFPTISENNLVLHKK